MDTKTDTPDEKSLYAQMKALSTKLEFLDITEGYVKDEMANLKREMVSFKITFSFSYYENHQIQHLYSLIWSVSDIFLSLIIPPFKLKFNCIALN